MLRKDTLDRITLGGEAALLEQANHTAFPKANITQAYATTQLGEVHRVGEDRAGVPAAWLGKALSGGSRLAIRRGNELLVPLSRDNEASVYCHPTVTGKLVAGEIVLADPLPHRNPAHM